MTDETRLGHKPNASNDLQEPLQTPSQVVPEIADFWSLDEVAECCNVPKELYTKLWSFMPSDEEMGPAPDEDHWTGGPAEYRSSDRPSGIKLHWHKFTPEEQAMLFNAIKEYEGQ